MDKQPLYSIDSLFQQKLEELPVDVSEQGAQWLALSKTLHQPAAGWLSLLQQPWVKWLYLTAVALVPFGVFYIATQQEVTTKAAQGNGGGHVTRSLVVLRTPVRMTPSHPVSVDQPTLTAPASKQGSALKPVLVKPVEKPATLVAPSLKSEDSVQAAPVKKELPVIKKTDSSYIYWQ